MVTVRTAALADLIAASPRAVPSPGPALLSPTAPATEGDTVVAARRPSRFALQPLEAGGKHRASEPLGTVTPMSAASQVNMGFSDSGAAAATAAAQGNDRQPRHHVRELLRGRAQQGKAGGSSGAGRGGLLSLLRCCFQPTAVADDHRHPAAVPPPSPPMFDRQAFRPAVDCRV